MKTNSTTSASTTSCSTTTTKSTTSTINRVRENVDGDRNFSSSVCEYMCAASICGLNDEITEFKETRSMVQGTYSIIPFLQRNLRLNSIREVLIVVVVRYSLLVVIQETSRLLKTFLNNGGCFKSCLLYTSPSPRDKRQSRMPSSA